MEEIKFRALLNNGKLTKTYTLQEVLQNGEDHISEEAFECKNSICEYIGFCECDFDVNEYDINNFLQYTGLNDINGVEIYKGYIAIDSDGYIYLIDFKKGGFVAVHAPKCRAESEWECKWDYLGSIHDELEVIGNIYENPELLHVKE